MDDGFAPFPHIQHPGAAERAQIAGLSAALGVKSGGGKGDIPALFHLFAAGDGGGEGF